METASAERLVSAPRRTPKMLSLSTPAFSRFLITRDPMPSARQYPPAVTAQVSHALCPLVRKRPLHRPARPPGLVNALRPPATTVSTTPFHGAWRATYDNVLASFGSENAVRLSTYLNWGKSGRASSINTIIGTKELEEAIDTARAERTATTWNIVGANLLALVDVTVIVGSLTIVRTYALLPRCD